MEREVLSCLAGYPGNIYYLDKKNSSLRVNIGLGYLHPSEEEILARIGIIASQYKKLNDFLDSHHSMNFKRSVNVNKLLETIKQEERAREFREKEKEEFGKKEKEEFGKKEKEELGEEEFGKKEKEEFEEKVNSALGEFGEKGKGELGEKGKDELGEKEVFRENEKGAFGEKEKGRLGEKEEFGENEKGELGEFGGKEKGGLGKFGNKEKTPSEFVNKGIPTLGEFRKEEKATSEGFGITGRAYLRELEEDDTKLKGAYGKAFLTGLTQVLNIYKADLARMEGELSRDAGVSLTYFLQLEKYSKLFVTLSDLIEEIISKKLIGCQILDLVFRRSLTGVNLVKDSMERLSKGLLIAFISQLSNWLIQGSCNTTKEFFIESTIIPNKSAHEGINKLIKNFKRKPRKCYKLKQELIPHSIVKPFIEENILFIGESIEIIASRITDHDRLFFVLDCVEVQERDKLYREKLRQLIKGNSFPLMHFFFIVKEMRRCASEQLRKLIIETCDLLSHLRAFKKYYFLGHAEFFHHFLGSANEALKSPVSSKAYEAVHRYYNESLMVTNMAKEKYIDNFSILFLDDEHEAGKASESKTDKEKTETKTDAPKAKMAWNYFGVHYKVPAPLDSILTEVVLDRYLSIFRFLISVRRVEIEIQKSYFSHLIQKRMERHTCAAHFCQLHSHMSFFIIHLQYYLMVDVIECQFDTFIEKMESVKEYEVIQEYHSEFLNIITTQCFLNIRPVYLCIQDILELCSTFSSLCLKIKEEIGPNETMHFEDIRLNFQRQTSLLFRLLNGIRNLQTSPYLNRLLGQLDFNEYITNSGHLGGPYLVEGV